MKLLFLRCFHFFEVFFSVGILLRSNFRPVLGVCFNLSYIMRHEPGLFFRDVSNVVLDCDNSSRIFLECTIPGSHGTRNHFIRYCGIRWDREPFPSTVSEYSERQMVGGGTRGAGEMIR